MDIFNRLRAWAISRGIAKQKPDRNGFVANITEELGEYLEAFKSGDQNGKIDAIADIRVFCATELVKEGYDIEKVDNEVLCVVESRIGAWDETNNKFQKDMSNEAMANWYEPDYDKCKDGSVPDEEISDTRKLIKYNYEQNFETLDYRLKLMLDDDSIIVFDKYNETIGIHDMMRQIEKYDFEVIKSILEEKNFKLKKEI